MSTKLPPEHQWILNLAKPLPRMITAGLSLYGTTEYPGKNKNNPVIMSMADRLGVTRDIFPNDETAWCALAHCWVCVEAGKPMPFKGYQIVRAASFLQWGVAVPIAMFGDTIVVRRDGGDHVFMYIAEDPTHYHGLGGNQANSYNIIRIAKDRVVPKIGIRRLYLTGPPPCVSRYFVAPDGTISENEA